MNGRTGVNRCNRIDSVWVRVDLVEVVVLGFRVLRVCLPISLTQLL